MTLMIRGLSLDDANIRANILETLLATIQNEGGEISESPVVAVMSEHASSLIKATLHNSAASEMTSAVCISCLQSLHIIYLCSLSSARELQHFVIWGYLPLPYDMMCFIHIRRL